MPNDFAYAALLIWPIITIVLYRKYPVITATFWVIVGGYLILPVGVEFDFPLIPALDKNTIPVILAFIGCRYIAKKKITLLPSPGIERKLIIILFLGSIGTILTNNEPVVEPNRYISGLNFRDTLSTVASQWLLLLPFILGLQIIKNYEDQIKLMKLMVIAGLWYSLLIIFEIRMSPQLHTWVYGFFPHSWAQQVRYGGFRPVVFLGHGLKVSIFIMTFFAISVTLFKLKITKFSNIIILLFIAIVLVLSKGFGAIILGLLFVVSLLFFSNSKVRYLAMFIAGIAVTYPLLCIFDIFPHQFLVESIGSIDPRRAASLQYRFDQESALLGRAMEKITFGWGTWGRNRLENSVVDGYWIGVIGTYGLVGFVAIFGLMGSAVLKATQVYVSEFTDQNKWLLVGHSLLVALLMLDQIPNHSESPYFWLIVGALSARSVHNNSPGDKKKVSETPIQTPNNSF